MPSRVEDTVESTRSIASLAALIALLTGCPDDTGLTSATDGGGGGSSDSLEAPTEGIAETGTSTSTSGVSGSMGETAGPDDPTGWATTSTTDPVGPCNGDPLCELPPEEKEP